MTWTAGATAAPRTSTSTARASSRPTCAASAARTRSARATAARCIRRRRTIMRRCPTMCTRTWVRPARRSGWSATAFSRRTGCRSASRCRCGSAAWPTISARRSTGTRRGRCGPFSACRTGGSCCRASLCPAAYMTWRCRREESGGCAGRSRTTTARRWRAHCRRSALLTRTRPTTGCTARRRPG